MYFLLERGIEVVSREDYQDKRKLKWHQFGERAIKAKRNAEYKILKKASTNTPT